MAVGISGLAQTAVAALFTGASEPVLESKWHQPFSEPVRQKVAPQLAVALIASGLAYVEAAPLAETVTESRWHQPWSEPVRVRPALPTGEQPFFAWQPAPSPFVATGWYVPLSEPVRVRALASAQQQAFVPDPLPRVSFSWCNWLAEPVRIKPALPTGEQQVSPFDEDIVFVDRWFAGWSEPVVKARPRLIEAGQQWLAFNPPFNAGAVQSEWSGPPPSLVRFQYQAFARAPAAPELFPLPGGGGWYLPDPTRPPDERGEPRRAKKQGAPRAVEPKIAPPTFAETIAAQQPARLADVLGSVFLPQLAALTPPALDLYIPPASAVAAPARQAAISQATIDDIQDRLDAMEALRVLDEEEQQRKAQIIGALMRGLGVKT